MLLLQLLFSGCAVASESQAWLSSSSAGTSRLSGPRAKPLLKLELEPGQL